LITAYCLLTWILFIYNQICSLTLKIYSFDLKQLTYYTDSVYTVYRPRKTSVGYITKVTTTLKKEQYVIYLLISLSINLQHMMIIMRVRQSWCSFTLKRLTDSIEDTEARRRLGDLNREHSDRLLGVEDDTSASWIGRSVLLLLLRNLTTSTINPAPITTTNVIPSPQDRLTWPRITEKKVHK
jgi:hypothetical protein